MQTLEPGRSPSPPVRRHDRDAGGRLPRVRRRHQAGHHPELARRGGLAGRQRRRSPAGSQTGTLAQGRLDDPLRPQPHLHPGRAGQHAAGLAVRQPRHPMAAHPDQVWIDGVAQQQVASLGQVTPAPSSWTRRPRSCTSEATRPAGRSGQQPRQGDDCPRRRRRRPRHRRPPVRTVGVTGRRDHPRVSRGAGRERVDHGHGDHRRQRPRPRGARSQGHRRGAGMLGIQAATPTT